MPAPADVSALEAAFAAGALVVALEVTPPRRPLRAVLLRRARLLGDRAHAIHVIQRADRQPSLDAALALREAGLEPVWHLATRGRTRAGIGAEIERAAAGGIDTVLCVRGDHRVADTADTPTLREAVSMLRARLPGCFIGVTANQYLDARRVLRNLLPKLRAGARFLETQPVFALDPYRAIAEAVRERAPAVRLLPMVMPLVSEEVALRIEKRLHVGIPETWRRALRRGGEEAGWQAFEDVLRALRESGLADGFAVMTPVMDPPAAVGERIAAALDRAGAG